MIDRFADGVAISIKSLDLNAAKYMTEQNLTRAITGYIDKVAQFQGAAHGQVAIRAGEVLSRGLDLAVPYSGTPMQQSVLNNAIQYGLGRGVSVNVIIVPMKSAGAYKRGENIFMYTLCKTTNGVYIG